MMVSFTTFEGLSAEEAVAVGAEAVVLRELVAAAAVVLRIVGPLRARGEWRSGAGRLAMARSL